MEVNISEHFTYKKLIRYVLPCVAMMVMTSVYSIVDGFFVSNYAGKNAFAAVNLIMPVLMAIASFGFMIGTGGSALVAFYLGLKDKKKANEVFSMLIFLILIGAAVIAGAAAATFASQCVGGLIPFVYFVRKNKSALQISPTRFDWKSIGKACSNGSSEMLSNLSISLVSVLYNFQLMRAAAENGIAAYGVVMYASYLAVAVYMGYAIGINPIVGYHYGAKNRKELHNILKNSLVITGCAALVITAVTEILALPVAKIFVGYDEVLCQMTRKGFMLYSVSYLFSGFNIFGSAFFTGLNNGKVSAAISFLRTLVIQIIAVVLLPVWFGIDGIWCAVTVAEVITLLVTVTFLIRGRKQYGY